MNPDLPSRRAFLAQAAAATGVLALAQSVAGEDQATRAPAKATGQVGSHCDAPRLIGAIVWR
jgi:hypothetical protein